MLCPIYHISDLLTAAGIKSYEKEVMPSGAVRRAVLQNFIESGVCV